MTFKEKAGNIDHNFRILHKPPEVFLTMFLPKTISDTAVHLAFQDCGLVHQLFAGTYKRDFQKIQNIKHLIKLSPYVKCEIPHQNLLCTGQKKNPT